MESNETEGNRGRRGEEGREREREKEAKGETERRQGRRREEGVQKVINNRMNFNYSRGGFNSVIQGKLSFTELFNANIFRLKMLFYFTTTKRFLFPSASILNSNERCSQFESSVFLIKNASTSN